jgi:hypothetical protein
MQISITPSLTQAEKDLKALAQKVLPAALIGAINDQAFATREAIHNEMGRVFDKPTPYTLRSNVVEKATAGRPEAWVGLRKDGGFRQALAHEYSGGSRRFKKIEGKFRSLGLVPDGYIVVASKYLDVDGYGNVSPALYRKIANQDWRGRVGSQAYFTSTKKSRRGKARYQSTYIQMPPKNRSGHVPGIYQRIDNAEGGGTLRPILLFVRPGSYERAIKLEDIATRVNANRKQYLANAMAYRIARALA